jgi:hypothetical protein
MDVKFWIFLVVFALTQCLVALSINVRLNNEAMSILNRLSAQVACTAGDSDMCGIFEEVK